MSTAKCKSCGKDVDVFAKTCMHCGRKDPTVDRTLHAVVFVLFLALFLGWLFW